MDSNKFTPRLLGIVFVIQAVASLVSGLMSRALIESDNISNTMINISNAPGKMLGSIVGELITAIAIILLAVVLYTTLKKQNKIIARWALGLRITEVAVLAVSRIFAFSLLYTSQLFVKAGAPDSSYFHTLGSLFYESASYGYEINMLFFILGGLLFYYLLLKSKYVPIVFPIWGITATSLAFIGTLLGLFGIIGAFSVTAMALALPNLPFELAIGVWLMIKGFRP